VTPQWLAQHINYEDLVVVDVRIQPIGLTPKKAMRDAFASGHIPSAVYFDPNDVADKNNDLSHMLPTAEEFSKAVGKLGINEQHRMVFYDDGDSFSALRSWWILRHFGAQHVYVLDGGLSGWQALCQPLESGSAQPKHKPLTHASTPMRWRICKRWSRR